MQRFKYFFFSSASTHGSSKILLSCLTSELLAYKQINAEKMEICHKIGGIIDILPKNVPERKRDNVNCDVPGSRRILVKSLDKEKKQELVNVAVKRKREEERLQQGETVAESGRLFLRNLAYSVMEDDLRPLFEKYGRVFTFASSFSL